MSETLHLTQDLISRMSVSPEDAGCQDLLAARLKHHGFDCEHLNYHDVKNLWATHGNAGPVFMLLGHTDVVPTGPLEQWTSPPFEPIIRDGKLYGRGSADMKGSVAAMTIALERFVRDHPAHPGTVGLLITSDEEAKAIHGVRQVAETFKQRGEKLDYCLVGEPSCETQFGDTIKIGRRGSLNGVLILHGLQGHIAYPQKALNPLPIAARIINDLTNIAFDNGNDHFPPTSFQISNIHAGTGANNIIPGCVEIVFNFRYSPESTIDGLQQRVKAVIENHHQDVTLEWRLSGEPFYTQDQTFINAVQTAVEAETNLTAALSTVGGTSDGRFIAPLGCQVVEFGPINASIHQIDEWVHVDELERLNRIYYDIMCRVMLGQRF